MKTPRHTLFVFPSLSQCFSRLALATALFCFALTTEAQVKVDTVGGGPNPTNPRNYGYADGDTFFISQFNSPQGLALDAGGKLLFVADTTNNAVRQLDLAGNLTSTLVNGLNRPVDVAVDTATNVYVLTAGDGVIRKYNLFGNLLLINATGLVIPTAMALDPEGNIYVAELAGRVKKFNAFGALLNTYTFTNGTRQLRGLEVLDDGQIAVSDTVTNGIFLLNPVNNSIRLVAGGKGVGTNNGTVDFAKFNRPQHIAKTGNGFLVIADRGNNRVRLLNLGAGVVTTLYGSTAGWRDDETGTGTALGREPSGVVMAANGDLYVSEAGNHIIRKVTGAGLVGSGSTSTNGTGGSGGTVGGPATGNNPVISFGFEAGEGSSEFVGSAGQAFYAPVTLTLRSPQPIYALQFNLTASNNPGSPTISSGDVSFESFLSKPVVEVPGFYRAIPPAMFSGNYLTNFKVFINSAGALETNVTVVPILMDLLSTNSTRNLLMVGWLERFGPLGTNLYDTHSQDLIKYSLPHETLFDELNGRVVVGAYKLRLPASATPGNSYRIRIGRPSASDALARNVLLDPTTNGSLTAGPINALKDIVIGSRPYIVGDVSPFRWFNSGDFGDGNVVNNDVLQIFKFVIYGMGDITIRPPPLDSDMFDALDSSDGTLISLDQAQNGDDTQINNVVFGDGQLNVDDIYVTYRRSLDDSLLWYARYWSNGIRQAAVVPNLFYGAPNTPLAPLSATEGSSVARSVSFSAADVVASGNTVQVPIRASIAGDLPVRVLMLSLSVRSLEGSPALSQPLQFTPNNNLGSYSFPPEQSGTTFGAVWLNSQAPGITGDAVVGVLTITLPAGANDQSSYLVAFDHVSASPNGLALFPKTKVDGVVTMANRPASGWNDSIPDSWRLKYFGSVSNPLAGADSDADGDGISNADEFAAGTNPSGGVLNQANTPLAPLSSTVNFLSSVEIITPSAGSSFTHGNSVTIQADAIDPDGISKVEFYRGSSKIAEATSEPYQVTLENLTPGTYTITAKATDGVEARIENEASATFSIMAVSSTVDLASAAGNYNGLFYDTNELVGVTLETAGFFNLNLNNRGRFSGKLQTAGRTLPFSGSVSNGVASVNVRKGTSILRLNFALGATGSDELTGTVSNETWTAQLVADRATFGPRNKLGARSGRYTMAMRGSSDSTTSPGGNSYGSFSLDKHGNIRLNGRLGDSSVINQGVPVSKSGEWPFYKALYGNKGVILGWIQIADTTAGTVSGLTRWIKPANVRERFYPAGFTNDLIVVGSRYTAPRGHNGRVLALTNGEVVLSGGNLANSISNSVTIDSRNRLINNSSNRLNISFVTPLGLFNGNFQNPQTRRSVPLKGAVLQEQNLGLGYFAGTNNTGSVVIQAPPP